MTQIVTRLYDSYADAAAALHALRAAGVGDHDLSLVSSHADPNDPGLGADNSAALDGLEPVSDTASAAGTGAGVGGVLGAGAGLAAGLGLMAIPGLGPVVAVGWLAAAAAGLLAGAAAGGAAGGLVGALQESGLPETDAHVYTEGIQRGGALVTARIEDARRAEIEAILGQHSSVDPTSRGDVYRSEGWSGFDANRVSRAFDDTLPSEIQPADLREAPPASPRA